VEGAIFETGIKAIDLLSPLERGGKGPGCLAARAWAKPC
jgi:F0F1-type ATP synthase beta subunit